MPRLADLLEESGDKPKVVVKLAKFVKVGESILLPEGVFGEVTAIEDERAPKTEDGRRLHFTLKPDASKRTVYKSAPSAMTWVKVSHGYKGIGEVMDKLPPWARTTL